ncbi:MAG: succinate dehydrogenase cytochrome b subunit [Chitinophagales bacterium]
MSWVVNFFSSSVGKKVIMSLTGLFLCLFLAVHMSGNFLLLQDDGGVAFNEYTKFMTTFAPVKIVSFITFAFIIFHIIDGLFLAFNNRKARPVKYAVSKPSNSWASRNMALLGVIIFFFLVVHLKSFWFEMKFGSVPLDVNGNKDLYKIVYEAFSQVWYVAIYLVSLVAIGFHLSHGFQSAFQSLGLNHGKYTPFIKGFGWLFSIGIPLGFAIQPIYVFLKSQGII